MVPEHRGTAGDWEKPVFRNDKRGPRRVVRMVYEIVTFQALRDALRCKEIWMVGAHSFRDPEEDLPKDFAARRVENYAELRKPLDPREFIAELKADYGFIPALGIGAYWTVFVLAIHGVWSIAVPISIVEAGSRRPDTPWLGKVGLTVSAVLFLLGGAVPIALASPAAIYPLSAAQITCTLITAATLIIAAFLSVRFRRPLLPATSASPWTVFAITIAAGLAFWLPSLLAMVSQWRAFAVACPGRASPVLAA
ncbi:hypothetical protein [Nonomuraea sp. KM88]|uniref:hypothetical protein n=1 Tax=Nonomuraea sp. KM88 TaxID=3457427 RepID=UPI003FCCE869